jgi:hypothetical protein
MPHDNQVPGGHKAAGTFQGKNGGAFWRGPDRQALHRRGSWIVGTISQNLLSQHTGVITSPPQ